MVAQALPFSWEATAQNDCRNRQEIADSDQKEKPWWFNMCADALANQSCIPGLLVGLEFLCYNQQNQSNHDFVESKLFN